MDIQVPHIRTSSLGGAQDTDTFFFSEAPFYFSFLILPVTPEYILTLKYSDNIEGYGIN